MTKHFIGYARLGDLIADLIPGKPIEVNAITEAGKPDRRFGISHVSELLIVSQIQGEDVLYWRVKVGGFTAVPGGVYPGDEKHYDRVKSALNLTKSYLNSRGVSNIRAALVSLPIGYKHLQGSIDFMSYDKETDRFLPLEEEKESE